MIISRNAWVVVADGGRANIFENVGEIGEINLKLLFAVDQHNGYQHGHTHSSLSNHKSSHEGKEPHQADKLHFLKNLASGLATDLQASKFEEIVLIASPDALGDIRQHLSKALEAKIVKQINKDYTHLAANELTKTLLSSHA